MTDQDRGGAEPRRGPGDGHDPSRRSEDLRIDDEARRLLERLWVDDDGDALAELGGLLGERLDALEPELLDDLGSMVPLDLATEWFTELLTSPLPPGGVPAHPMAAARDWMEARGRALVTTLAARPQPWEDGFGEDLPAEWLGRLAIESDEPLATYVTLVALHRLPLTTRRVMRARQVEGLSVPTCAQRLNLSPGQVEEHERTGRRAMLEAIDRLLRGGEA